MKFIAQNIFNNYRAMGARNEMPLYQNIEDNQFSPLLISQRAALQLQHKTTTGAMKE